MKRGVWLGIAALGAVLSLGASGSPEPAEKGAVYGLEVKIRPIAEAPGQFVCEAAATDLATGQVVAAPRIQVQAGKSGVTSSSEEGGKRYVTFSVSVEGEGKEARYTMLVHEGETLVASQKASVKLR